MHVHTTELMCACACSCACVVFEFNMLRPSAHRLLLTRSRGGYSPNYMETTSMRTLTRSNRTNARESKASTKGWKRAKAFDHTCLAHCLWAQLIKLKTEAFIKRVPTEVNIADLPSREEYSLLESIGAEWVQPKLDQALCRPDSWESLSLSHQGIGRSSDRESAE